MKNIELKELKSLTVITSNSFYSNSLKGEKK